MSLPVSSRDNKALFEQLSGELRPDRRGGHEGRVVGLECSRSDGRRLEQRRHERRVAIGARAAIDHAAGARTHDRRRQPRLQGVGQVLGDLVGVFLDAIDQSRAVAKVERRGNDRYARPQGEGREHLGHKGKPVLFVIIAVKFDPNDVNVHTLVDECLDPEALDGGMVAVAAESSLEARGRRDCGLDLENTAHVGDEEHDRAARIMVVRVEPSKSGRFRDRAACIPVARQGV